MAFRIVVPSRFLASTYCGTGERVCLVCFNTEKATSTWCGLCGVHVHLGCVRLVAVQELNRTAACQNCAGEYGQ